MMAPQLMLIILIPLAQEFLSIVVHVSQQISRNDPQLVPHISTTDIYFLSCCFVFE